VVLSVVIVTYNNLAEIGACLEALGSALASFEAHLHLIDNASSDGTAELLRAFAARPGGAFARCDLACNPENRGFTAAVNQGLARSRGDLILLLNPDVVVPADVLPVLLRELERDPKIGIIAPQLRFPDGRIQPSCRRFPRRRDVVLESTGLVHLAWRCGYHDWKMRGFDHRHSAFIDQPQGAFLLARRQVVQEVGLLDERFYMFFSDVEWCERVHAAGWRIRFCSEVFVFHHKGASVYRDRRRMLVTSTRSFVDYFALHDHSCGSRMATRLVALLLRVTLGLRLLAETVKRS